MDAEVGHAVVVLCTEVELGADAHTGRARGCVKQHGKLVCDERVGTAGSGSHVQHTLPHLVVVVGSDPVAVLEQLLELCGWRIQHQGGHTINRSGAGRQSSPAPFALAAGHHDHRAAVGSARMNRLPRSRALVFGGRLGLLALAFTLAFPAAAQAHGIVGRADLPIPVWLFSWAAAIVLVVSFVALSALWMTPQLQQQHRRRLFRLPAAAEWFASLVGIALFALVVYSGFAGAQVEPANFSVTFIYVIFWVGLPVLSVLFGDVFRAFSPWRTCARAVVALVGVLRGATARGAARGGAASGGGEAGAREPLLRYSRRLGMWPAVAGLVGFGWMELVYVLPDRDQPSTLAALSVAYFAAMLLGMGLFGVEEWNDRGDGFAAYFQLFSRLSALTRDEEGYVCLRRPLSGLTDLPLRRGTVALICTIIGTTTFDGLSNGGLWRQNELSLQTPFSDLGFHQIPAIELTYSAGLVLCILLIAGIYRLGIVGVASVSDRYSRDELTRTFAHTLVPVAFAYVLAHYFSLLIWQGQAIGYLASDPLGNGANILGTSAYQINYRIISYAAIWYVQVAALLAGHVGGLILSHDRALVLYREPEDAVRSQYWMLAVMVAFTSFGLWLLSAVGT